MMYKKFIRPHFHYCEVIYHIPHITNPFNSTNTLTSLIERIENVQYQAALAITGTLQGTNRNKKYEDGKSSLIEVGLGVLYNFINT